ncbi:sugar ABC transporter permease [Actinomycetota bacterium Odt1-20B]
MSDSGRAEQVDVFGRTEQVNVFRRTEQVDVSGRTSTGSPSVGAEPDRAGRADRRSDAATTPSLTPDWAGPALDSLLTRAARTRAEVGARFPLFAEPGDGRWTTTGRGSWTGGFWAGLLWLRARHSGEHGDRAAARDCAGRLAPWIDADTATRGLILWYGTAFADGADRDALAPLRLRAARSCRGAFDERLGLVPWGSAFGGPRLLARVDGVPGLVPLLALVDPEAARSHLRVHLELCLGRRPFHWAWRREEGERWAPCAEPPPGWGRGPAWLLLALADARHALGESGAGDLTPAVEQLTPTALVPAADATGTTVRSDTTDRSDNPDNPDNPGAPEDPGGPANTHSPADPRSPANTRSPGNPHVPDRPLDTSAAAITALALLKLGERERAVAVLERLVHRHLTADGRLLDGCYDLGSATAVRHELIWGDFFLAHALAALTGLVGPHEA